MSSDKPDYVPGDVAILSGTGWEAGETVDLHIVCTCGCDEHLAGVAGENGDFTDVEYAIESHHVGAFCTVHATGESSGRFAMTTFTDGNWTVKAAPAGVTFMLTGSLHSAEFSGCGTTPIGSICTGAGCLVDSTTGVTFFTNNSQRVRLVAPLTAIGGGTFVEWRSTSGVVSQNRELCEGGNGAVVTYTAHYSCAAPTITCPSNIVRNTDSGQCSAANVTWTNGGSNCGDTTRSCTVTSGSTFNKGTTTVTCTASNGTGSASCSFDVAVIDNQAPTITCPSNVTAECPVGGTGSPTVSDNCPGTTVTSSDQVADGCGDTEDTTRTFTATDGAGRTATCTQSISEVDTTDPSVTAPADQLALECLSDTSPASTGTATSSDTCGATTLGFEDGGVAGCGQTVTLSRVWTATDACGNAASDTQIIATVDTTAPSITAPAGATVECTGDTSPGATGSATASDQCGQVGVAHSDSFAGGCGNTGVITRAFTATDECGLTASASQSITIQDTTDPTLVVPPSATIECGLPADTGGATASDTCGGAAVSFAETSTDGCGNTGTRSITFTATDDCGNDVSGTQTITTVDTTAPSVVAPPAASVECGDPLPSSSASGGDTCGGVSITSSDSFAASCGNAGVVTRTFTATDECGNPASAAQAISVVDSAAPSVKLTGAASVTVECGASFEDPGATATDRCEGDLGAVAGTGAVNTAVPGAYTRSYTAADDCANSATATREVIVADRTGPQITCPASQTVSASCEGTGELPTATATDTCGAATVVCTANGAPVGTIAPIGTYAITCTATDTAGNQNACSYNVQVVPGTAGSDIVWRWPLSETGVNYFLPGLVIPVKVHVNDCSGNRVSDGLHAFVEVTLDANGDGVYETELPEYNVGAGGAGGLMALQLGRWHYNLLTWGYPFGTASTSARFRLTVRVLRASSTGPVLVREESVTLESLGSPSWRW